MDAKKIDWLGVLIWFGIVCLVAALVVTAVGCAGLPRTVQEPDGAGGWVEVPVVPYYLPGTGAEVFTAAPAGPAGGQGGVDWLTVGLQVVGVLTGTSTLMSALSPAGRRTLGVVGDPNAGWKDTARGLGNVATFGLVKPPEPVAPAKPARTHP